MNATDLPPTGPRAAAQRMAGGDGPTESVSPAAARGLEQQLLSPMALGYMPRLPISRSMFSERLFFDFYMDIDWMCRDDAIRLPLQFVMGPAAHAEAEVEGKTHEQALFIAKQWQWFWSNGRDLIQEEGYPHGWAPAEVTYDVQDGLMVQSLIETFNPRDADPALDPKTRKPCEIQVQNTEEGTTKLWAWRDNFPNKGFWYSHLARRGQRRGQSQIWSAYRPWLRLTGRDGAEELIDLGFYRLGLPIIAVDHPQETYKATGGAAPPYAINGTVHTRDEARAIGENVKSGASAAISSKRDSNGNRQWDLRAIQTGANGTQLIEYVEYLERKCSKGCGVPPELFQAAQTGSGYSGRAIPLEGFLTAQQRPVNDLSRQWMKQIGLPLLKWNYGPDAWARLAPKPILGSYKQNAWDKPGQPPQGPPPDQATAMMSAESWASSSSLLVRGSGGIRELGRSHSVIVPDMSWLATEADDDVSRMMAMSDDELAAIADGEDFGSDE